MSDELGKGGDQKAAGTAPGPTGGPKQTVHNRSGGWWKVNQGKPDRSTDTPLGAKNGGAKGLAAGD